MAHGTAVAPCDPAAISRSPQIAHTRRDPRIHAGIASRATPAGGLRPRARGRAAAPPRSAGRGQLARDHFSPNHRPEGARSSDRRREVLDSILRTARSVTRKPRAHGRGGVERRGQPRRDNIVPPARAVGEGTQHWIAVPLRRCFPFATTSLRSRATVLVTRRGQLFRHTRQTGAEACAPEECRTHPRPARRVHAPRPLPRGVRNRGVSTRPRVPSTRHRHTQSRKGSNRMNLRPTRALRSDPSVGRAVNPGGLKLQATRWGRQSRDRRHAGRRFARLTGQVASCVPALRCSCHGAWPPPQLHPRAGLQARVGSGGHCRVTGREDRPRRRRGSVGRKHVTAPGVVPGRGRSTIERHRPSDVVEIYQQAWPLSVNGGVARPIEPAATDALPNAGAAALSSDASRSRLSAPTILPRTGCPADPVRLSVPQILIRRR